MTTLSISRPGADEAAPFYHGYIAKVPHENLGIQLMEQLQELDRLLANVTDEAALARYAEGKWSIKEVLGHLIDSERIVTYRLLRIGRGDQTPLSGFDENAYVPAGSFDRRPLPTLLAEFRAVHQSTIALIEALPEESWTRRGLANGKPVSARALAYIIVGHVATIWACYGIAMELERSRPRPRRLSYEPVHIVHHPRPRRLCLAETG